nr:hypothetical protein JVH1_4224 [Rhodococcus sp. JVH1]
MPVGPLTITQLSAFLRIVLSVAIDSMATDFRASGALTCAIPRGRS